jgi:hypothetical protein
MRWFVRGGACLFAGLLMAALVSGCSKPGPDATRNNVARALFGSPVRGEPLLLKGDVLMVENQSGRDWTKVEIWLNTYYRATASSIPAGARAQAPLRTFFDGYRRPFDAARTTPRSLRLTAELPDGQTFELKKTLP